MAKTSTNLAVWAALAGNLLVAASKFVAAAVSGSAAMLLIFALGAGVTLFVKPQSVLVAAQRLKDGSSGMTPDGIGDAAGGGATTPDGIGDG